MKNQIINGDCTEVLKTIADESVDFVLTDPPYFVRYKDCTGRTIANDSRPESVLGAFDDLYRVLKPHTFCISFYGWNRVDAFFHAWKSAGFTPVGHIVWRKNYASSTNFLNARHEQAYVLAKGRPAKPARPLDDVPAWEYTGNPSRIPLKKRSAFSNHSSRPSHAPATWCAIHFLAPAAPSSQPLSRAVLILASRSSPAIASSQRSVSPARPGYTAGTRGVKTLRASPSGPPRMVPSLFATYRFTPTSRSALRA